MSEYWNDPWTLESHTNELLSVYEQILRLAAVENG